MYTFKNYVAKYQNVCMTQRLPLLVHFALLVVTNLMVTSLPQILLVVANPASTPACSLSIHGPPAFLLLKSDGHKP